VIAQIALSMMLLVGAGLLIQTPERLENWDLDFARVGGKRIENPSAAFSNPRNLSRPRRLVRYPYVILDLAIAKEPPEAKRLTMVKVNESPFYIAMSEEGDLAYESSLNLDALAGRRWVIFERKVHPPVYDAVMQFAKERKVAPTNVQHIVVVPEDAYPLIPHNGGVAFIVKSGAIRIARAGITVRPLAEDSLILKTYLASRAEEKSKVVSEMVRAFMRKLSTFNPRPSPARTPA
jgi:hypothetical protein